MGKTKRQISSKEIKATNRIAALAKENGIELTDSYAVAKELVIRGTLNYAFTRWGIESGKRVLVVLSWDQMSIKTIDPKDKEKCSSIRSVAPEFVKAA